MIEEVPVVVSSFISDEDADAIAALLDARAVPVPNSNRRCALGFPSSALAAAAGIDNPVMELTGDSARDSVVLQISKLLTDVREVMEQHYGFELDLVNSSYTDFSEGMGIPMHSDSTKLDGSPFRDDGIPEELEMSAILYLNTGGGVDFDGGDIEFPNQNLMFTPVKGSLIHFRGDLDHKHEVKPILSGSRKVIIYFYARRGNVSDSNFFTTDSTY